MESLNYLLILIVCAKLFIESYSTMHAMLTSPLKFKRNELFDKDFLSKGVVPKQTKDYLAVLAKENVRKREINEHPITELWGRFVEVSLWLPSYFNEDTVFDWSNMIIYMLVIFKTALTILFMFGDRKAANYLAYGFFPLR